MNKIIPSEICRTTIWGIIPAWKVKMAHREGDLVYIVQGPFFFRKTAEAVAALGWPKMVK